MLVSLFAIQTLLVTLSSAHPHAHSHTRDGGLPSGTWYHRENHEVHNLFKRSASTDGTTYAAVGSDAWQNGWTYDRPTKDKLPTAWFKALDDAIAAGKIPDIPRSTAKSEDDSPTYPDGHDPNSPEICSQTYQCLGKGVIQDAPAGYFGSNFDDGPLPPTDDLVAFLSSNNVTTTHFMIGQNILSYPNQFLKAFNAGHDIAVHTWTHPHMTTLSNEDVVAELGATLEIIRNSTGGRVPRYWRPPYGDSDNRVNAIANEVFHLTTVWWNQDTEDWSINSATPPTTTVSKVESQLRQWINGDKSKGLNILEHELMPETVEAFKNVFPDIIKAGWKFKPITSLFENNTPYKNSDGTGAGAVTGEDILGSVNNLQAAASSGTSSPSGSPSGSPSTGGNSGSANPTSHSSSTGSDAHPTSSKAPSSAVELKAGSAGGTLPSLLLASLLFFIL